MRMYNFRGATLDRCRCPNRAGDQSYVTAPIQKQWLYDTKNIWVIANDIGLHVFAQKVGYTQFDSRELSHFCYFNSIYTPD